MRNLNKFPDWAFKMLAGLCFSQVKEQLTENLLFHFNAPSNPQGFICNGQFFTFIHNPSLIVDDPFRGDGRFFN